MDASLPPAFQFIKGCWRCEAFHYGSLREWFKAQGIRDTVPRWDHPTLVLDDQRQPHEYQVAALAWEGNERRGSIVLPTGAGKTFVAIHAMYQAAYSTLVDEPPYRQAGD